MTHGTVTAFDSVSGFGFISLDDGTRLFVDFTAAIDTTALRAGQRVTFRIAPGAMGLHATRVRAAQPAATISV